MNLSEMRADVYEVTKAYDKSTETVTSLLNEAQQYVVNRVVIPELKRYDVAYTVPGQAYTTLVSLAGGFSGKLLKVGKIADTIPKVYDRLELLVDDYDALTDVGDVEAVCLEGNMLWYALTPAIATAIPVVYLRLPSDLVEETDVPDFIPAGLHRQCLVCRVAEVLWDKVEDGFEEEKRNTLNYRSQCETGLVLLQEYIASNTRHKVSSMWGV